MGERRDGRPEERMRVCDRCHIVLYRCQQCNGWKCQCKGDGGVYVHYDDTGTPYVGRGVPPVSWGFRVAEPELPGLAGSRLEAR